MKFALVASQILAMTCFGSDSDTAKQFFAAIRSDDLPALRLLAKSPNVNVRGDRDTTPLMFAGAYGSVDSVKLLLAAGADPNASNALGHTALMWSVTEPAKAKLLVDKGADVNAKSSAGRTALMIAAAQAGSDPVVHMLIAKGADVRAVDKAGSTFLFYASGARNPGQVRLALEKGADPNRKNLRGLTPLMSAAGAGDADSVQILLSKHADPNAQTQKLVGGTVKNGPIALGAFTPLILAAASGPPRVVELLLEAGAKVDSRDVRGMTALHYAVSTEARNEGTVRLLLKAGATPETATEANETAIALAVKYNNPNVLKLLPVSATRGAAAETGGNPAPSPRAAAIRSLQLLQKVSDGFLNTGGCVSCHAQNLTALANSYALFHGLPVNQPAQQGMGMGLRSFFSGSRDGLLVRDDPAGGVDTIGYALLHLSAAKIEGDSTTDAMVHNLAAQQLPDGSWHSGAIVRAPMEDSDIERTALNVRALKLYSWPGRKADLNARVESAHRWLLQAKPVYNEDYSMQLLGLTWAGDRNTSKFARDLLSLQRADGGWGQNSNLSSDAYATGQSLLALVESGALTSRSPEFLRGIQYLMATQHEDGSWHVKSRAAGFQPYFQSGFPYDHDQWISMAGTAWATIALTFAAGETSGAI